MFKTFVGLVSTLKNGQLAKKKILLYKRHKMGAAFLNILWDEGFIAGYKIDQDYFRIFLKYKMNKPVIKSINFITKPGHKIYYRLTQLWKLQPNTGVVIISTNKGLMSLDECKRYKLGGQPLVIIQ